MNQTRDLDFTMWRMGMLFFSFCWSFTTDPYVIFPPISLNNSIILSISVKTTWFYTESLIKVFFFFFLPSKNLSCNNSNDGENSNKNPGSAGA